MGAFSRSTGFCLAALLLAMPAAAQVPASVVGRVVRFAGPDTLPIPGAAVVLHRVGASDQGPMDSVNADRTGRFRFRFRADTTAVYLLSARHDGITYFSSPVAREPATRQDDILLIVSDTSSSAPVAIAARSLILGAPEGSGDRGVVEVIEFANRGRQTRVAADSAPTLALSLARGGTGFSIENTDLSFDALQLRGDSLLVFAPIAPGTRMVILQYRLPAGTRLLELPGGLAVDTMQVLVEPGGVKLLSGLTSAGEQVIDGRAYQRWMGAWSADSTLVITMTGVVFRQQTALILLVGGLALALGAGLWWTRRRRGQVAPVQAPDAVPPRGAPALVEALARLDARYAAGREGTPAMEWQRYQAERQRLKAELEQALAGTGRRP